MVVVVILVLVSVFVLVVVFVSVLGLVGVVVSVFVLLVVCALVDAFVLVFALLIYKEHSVSRIRNYQRVVGHHCLVTRDHQCVHVFVLLVVLLGGARDRPNGTWRPSLCLAVRRRGAG